MKFAIFAALLLSLVPSKPSAGFVLDETGLLASTDVAQINDDIKQLSDSGAGQIGVLLTNDLRGKTRAELAVDVFKAWGIGYGDRGATGKGRGVLILLKPAFPDRGVKIEVGRDLEGRLNDGKVGELLRQAIPYFRESRYAQGLRYLIFALGPEMRVEQAEVDAPSLPAKSADDGGGILLPILAALIVAGALGWVFLALRRRRKRDIEELATPPSMHWRPVTVDRQTGAIEPVTVVNAPIVVINEEAPRQRRGWSDDSPSSYAPSPSYESPPPSPSYSPSPSYESSYTSSSSSSFDGGSSFGGGGDSGGAGADSSF